jgi:hypothetical protein
MSEQNGWVKLHRRLMSWAWKSDPNMVALWVDLLVRANHAPRQFQTLTIERGSCVVGLHSLSKSTGISIRGIRTCLTKLKSTNEVTSRSTNKFTIITIVNYSLYQGCDDDERQAERQAHRQTNDKQTTTNKNVRIKEEDPRSSLLPSSSYFDKSTCTDTHTARTPEGVHAPADAPPIVIPDKRVKYADHIHMLPEQYAGLVALCTENQQPETFLKDQIQQASDWSADKGRRHKDAAAFMRNWLKRAFASARRTSRFETPKERAQAVADEKFKATLERLKQGKNYV